VTNIVSIIARAALVPVEAASLSHHHWMRSSTSRKDAVETGPLSRI